MFRDNRINIYLNELYPGFRLKEWLTSDESASERVSEFIEELELLDLRAQYLSEEICLDSSNPNGLLYRITKLVKHYVKKTFPNDQARHEALDRICHGGNTKFGTSDSGELFGLLTSKLAPIQHESVEELIPLKDMKNVEVPTRFGDILFLPRDSNIIVIGDTHGDLASTKHVINEVNDFISEGAVIVFLGDYVNNGLKNWENLREVLKFQKANSSSVILLSGNHEFRETYLTALKEHFLTHWDHFTAKKLPERLRNRLPEEDNHYGHIRFDLIRSFGIAEGERIYKAFEDWGMKLPYICISDNLMISHSIGKIEGDKKIQLSDLINAKQRDAEDIKRLGYEAWKARKSSIHSAMVNNRIITSELLDEFRDEIQVNQFVVGHSHYRSGDNKLYGDKDLTTVASSDPYSPDSGHYMYYEMVKKRAEKRSAESLPDGDAFACYLSFKKAPDRKRRMKTFPVSVE